MDSEIYKIIKDMSVSFLIEQNANSQPRPNLGVDFTFAWKKTTMSIWSIDLYAMTDKLNKNLNVSLGGLTIN